MFYSQVILARKGPLGKIWLAAHFDKKLTKTQIFTTDISDSVDTIINPEAPLALRVSGQLMLGIVRIYSRKVRYLVADCTEAMWKIKLAFRPGNLDLVEMNVGNVDDNRYFGNILPDTEFPELAGAAFSEDMLSRFSTLRAARAKTIANPREITHEDFDLGLASHRSHLSSSPYSKSDHYEQLIDIPGSGERERSRSIRKDSSTSKRLSSTSQVSDIEFVRGARGGSSFGLGRPSDSSFRAPHMAFDDEDVPPFEEDTLFGRDVPPPMDNLLIEPDGDGPADLPFDEEFPSQLDIPVSSRGPESGDEEVDAAGGMQSNAASEDILIANETRSSSRLRVGTVTAPTAPPQSSKTKAKVDARVDRKADKAATKKRQRVVFDDSVELTSREIKSRLSDVSSIIRRLPDEPIEPRRPVAVNTVEDRLNQPSGLTGLCPELMGLFSMTMTIQDLPFPVVPREEEGVRESMGEGNIEFEDNVDIGEVEDIELPRENVSAEKKRERPSFSFELAQSHRESSSKKLSDLDRINSDDPYNDANIEVFGDDEYVPPPTPVHSSRASVASTPLSAGSSPGRGRLSQVREKMKEQSLSSSSRMSSDSPHAEADSSEGRGAWSARTAAVLDILREELRKEDVVSFANISTGASRRLAAASFMEILQLKTWDRIQVNQAEPFADIKISASESTFMPLVH